MELTMTFPVSKYHTDLIGDNLKYHNDLGVSSFLLLLHDLTNEEKNKVLLQIKPYNCQFIEWNNPIFEDSKIRTVLTKEAFKRFKSDWIINNDVDEYWISEKQNLQQILKRYDECNCLHVKRYNVMAYTEENEKYINPPRSYKYAITNPISMIDKDSYDAIKPLDFVLKSKAGKTCCRGYGVSYVGPGSHLIEIQNKLSKECKDLIILHYPYTTKTEFNNEIKRKFVSMLKDKKTDNKKNFHIKYLKHHFDCGKIDNIMEAIFPNRSTIEDLFSAKRITKISTIYDYFNSKKE